jgi:hypothetical protein
VTYVYLEDGFPEHEKVSDAGGDAAWLYVCGLCYVNRNLTGGRIPKTAVPRLSDRKRPMALAAKLVEVKLWEDDDTHFMIHDYGVRNATAEKKRKARVERARKAADARWHPPRADAPGMPQASAEHESSMPDAMPEQCQTMPPVRARTGVPNSPTPQLPDSRGGVSVSDTGPVTTRSLALTAPRKTDPLWDAVMAACGIEPGDITDSSRGAYNRAVADLRKLGVDPDEVRNRAAGFKLRWRDASLTPTALVRRWGECSNTAALQPAVSNGQAALLRAQARGR